MGGLLDCPQHRAKGCASGRVTIPGQLHPTVPEIALQWAREGAFVWSVRDGKAHKVSVRVIGRASGQILVEGALRQGEEVVVEGVQRLRPGSPVTVLNRQEP